jgi:hypothetical protein
MVLVYGLCFAVPRKAKGRQGTCCFGVPFWGVALRVHALSFKICLSFLPGSYILLVIKAAMPVRIGAAPPGTHHVQFLSLYA